MIGEKQLKQPLSGLTHDQTVIDEEQLKQPLSGLAYGQTVIGEKQLKQPLSGLAYGQIVYWVTMASSFIAMIGSVVASVAKSNFVTPTYWMSSIWQGKSTAEIWEPINGSLPVGHWYINYPMTGDVLTALGISIGVFSVTLAMVVSAIILFKEKSILFGALALIVAAITTVSMLALTPLPS